MTGGDASISDEQRAVDRRRTMRLGALALALGALFAVLLFVLRFGDVERRTYNFLLDWGRFAAAMLFAAAAMAWLYRALCRRWRWTQNLFLMCATLLIVVLIGELLLRVSNPNYYWYGGHRRNFGQGIFLPDVRFGHAGARSLNYRHHAPEYNVAVRHNAQGFRDREPEALGDGPPRLLFVGDSYTWGWGVALDDRYDRRTAAHLARLGHDVETVNAGVPGYCTVQEYLLLQELLPKIRPAIVVLQFCSNDLEDNDLKTWGGTPKPFFTLKDDGPSSGQLTLHASHLKRVEHPLHLPPFRLGEWAGRQLLKFSHAWRFVYYRAHTFRQVRMLKNSKVKIYHDVPNEPRRWRVTLALLDALDNLCRRHEARLVVLLVPEQIERYGRWNPGLWCPEVLGEHFTARGVPFLDLNRNEDGSTFDFRRNSYQFDTHWNHRGHDLAARRLAELLAGRLK